MKKFLLIILFITANSNFAWATTEDELKILITNNLIKEINWPNELQKNTYFNIGIFSQRQGFNDRFKALISNESYKGKNVRIYFSPPTSQSLDVLYIDSKISLENVLSQRNTNAALIITSEQEAPLLSMINLFTKGEHVTYQINPLNMALNNFTYQQSIFRLGGNELLVAQLFKDNRDKLNLLQSKLTNSAIDVARLTTQKEDLNNKIIEINNALSKSLAEQKQTEQRTAALKSELVSVNTKLSTLLAQINSYQQEIVQKEQQISILAGKESAMSDRVNQLHQDRIQLQQENSQLAADRNNKVSELSQLQVLSKDLINKTKQQEGKLFDYQVQVQTRNILIVIFTATLIVIAIALLRIFALNRKMTQANAALDASYQQLKTANRKVERLSKAIEQSMSAILVFDKFFAIEFANEAFYQMTGLSEQEVIGKSYALLCASDEGKAMLDRAMFQVREGNQWQGELQSKTRDGTNYWLSIEFSPVLDKQGNISYYLSSSNDITDQKATHSQLVVAKEQALVAAKEKSDFLSTMSHEIRTPMNAVLGMLQTINQRNQQRDITNLVTKANSSAKRLLGVINDVLDLSKLEADKLEIESIPFSLTEVLDDLINTIKPNLMHKQLGCIIDYPQSMPAQVIGDPNRLFQILLNLTTNAIKFTEQGAILINIQRLATSRNSMELQFDVVDTGIGMTKTQRAGLFRPFVQADSSITRKYGGSGLGLSICKRLTELMGGEIGVTSKIEQGSTFSLKLTLSINERDAVTPLPIGLSHLKAMIIDPLTATNHKLSQMLLNLGVSAVTNLSTLDEFRLVYNSLANEQRAPNLLIIDWDSTNTALLSELELIKKEPIFEELHVIIICHGDETNSSTKEHLDLAKSRHVIDGYVFKPLFSPDLVANICQSFDIAYVNEKSSTTDFKAATWKVKQFNDVFALAVEDNDMNQEVIFNFLEDMGINVIIANDGYQAVNLVRNATQRFDIILMDLHLPGMDGCETTQRLKQVSTLEDVPVIALTASSSTADKSRCREAGMQEFVAKPIDFQSFNDVLARVLPHKVLNATSQTVKKQSQPLPDVKGLDMQLALSRLNNNQTLYQTLLHRFPQSHADLVIQLTDLNNRDQALIAAHTLKNICANIGAKRQSSAYDLIENKIRTHQIIDPEIIENAIDQSRIIAQQINSYNLQTPTVNIGDSQDDIKEIYLQLKQYLSNHDSESINLYYRFEHCCNQQSHGVALEPIATHIQNYRYKEALNMLEKLDADFTFEQ